MDYSTQPVGQLQPVTQPQQPMFGPPPGQNPLSALPQYGGAGGGQQAAEFYAGRDFAQMFGRNPTQAELAQLAPAYLSGDPNKAGLGQGKAAIGQYYNAMSQTPANLYSQQQQQWSQAAPQHYDSVNQIFQSTYGRRATSDELSHYGSLMASGQADPYQLSQFLQALPEYQNSQDTKFRQGLDTELQKSDENFFNRVSPQISQKYAMMGRPTSPALSVAMTDLAAQLSNNRQQYLAQLSASQYGNNKTAAMGRYGQTQQDVNSRINSNPGDQFAGIQGVNSRVQNLMDYSTQMQNWTDHSHGGGASPLDYLNNTISGAMAGGKVGGPWGAVAGGAIGAGGTAVASNNSRY